MKTLKGTKTLQNLINSFAGESQARNRYTYYAGTARKEGYAVIEEIFMKTADDEKMHAKQFFKAIADNLGESIVLNVNGDYPVAFGNTVQNLRSAAAGENEEHTKLYPEFAKTAEEEGFKEISTLYKLISKIEERHEKRYLKLADNIEKNKFFSKDQPVVWMCRKCGHLHTGINAPEKCAVCKHPKEHFEIFCENY